ncbi:unnamed protein product [Clonostachys byssicola]|uniref:D-serine dehydratase-like domain-containing protein n=1 Tax=Clonostachys byssicola TaxID=160290 RepID=A0A9N9XUJ8_9HYPO|nr:unnamed protein product [Clonostachys byssicola]
MNIPQRHAPSVQELRNYYVGHDIQDVPKPALILDAAIARRHCQTIRHAIDALGVGFRAHIKTHKTAELARLSVGDEMATEARFIVSTIPEIERLMPLLKEYRSNGRRTNVLYGIPLPPSQVRRLATLAQELDPGSIAVLVDNPAQLDQAALTFYEIAQYPVGVYVKVDTGYHRAGLPPTSLNKGGLLDKISLLEATGHVTFLGLYSHSSLSYNDCTPKQAMDNLAGEIRGCLEALHASAPSLPCGETAELTISVGASPQIVSVRNFTADNNQDDSANLRNAMRQVEEGSFGRLKAKLELHAGVYTVLDMQQLAACACSALQGAKPEDEVAVSVVAEVCSVYNGHEREQPEALLAVGTLGLGREPCHAYSGWGIVSVPRFEAIASTEEQQRRIVVARISQEHSIISWETQPDDQNDGAATALPPIPVQVGQTVRVYPNHACVTGAMYGWYLVVDSESDSAGSEVVDVWIRASGW